MSDKNSPNTLNSPPTSTTSNNFDLPCQRSSKEMSASAAASAAAIALALDLKPKHPITDATQSLLLQHQNHQQQQQNQQQQQQQQQQQKIKKLVRRNASDKLKLIQMVHDNPILWDSRLPNFKGAEEEKNRAWEQIGKEFNAPGRRVARAFKSLRESYRRELAHVKLMGNNFKPKWSLYDAMDFLRDVIRERKGGSHSLENTTNLGLNLSALAHHMTAAAANNNLSNNTNNNNNNSNKNNYKLNSLHSSFNDSALNLSKCSSSLNVSGDDYYYYVKPELDISNQNTNPNANTAITNGATNNPINIPAAHQNSQHNDSRVSSTRNDTSNQNNTYDDLDNSSMRSGEDENSSVRNTALSHQGSDEVEELEAIDADFPYPLILNSNSPSTSANAPPANKRRRKHLHSTGPDDEEEDDDEDDYEGQMLQQHRHLRNQQNQAVAAGLMGDIMPPPQTVREVLNSKFCGFISAKLNSMEDSEADNLMNKILMLLVQTQMSQTANNSPLQMANGTNDSK